ncbi:MAG: DUF1146 domain-containing protein [Erysipelotrichaceae bacterium]|nr:DUF1146 domain-containing protein [Erysipelotrichaceae bacterium]
MSTLPYVQLIVFFVLFGISFYALSCVKFDKFCKIDPPARVYVLLFLLSLILAYLSSQAILSLTVFNGL